MSEFINTIDALGDDVVMDSIIDKSITEFKDDTLTTIGQSAFYGCTSLTDINLPNTESISASAFNGCTALTTVEIPNVTTIGGAAFKDCTSLEEMNFPSVVGTLGEYAFDSCTNLKSVNLPGVITSTGSGVFKNCTSLTNINLPNIESIGSWFVQNCPVEVLDFPKLKSTSLESFINTFSLVAVILRRTDVVCTAGTTLFNSNTKSKQTPVTVGTGFIYVPRALVEDYKVATNWSQYASQFRALEDYTVDGTVTGDIREHCESITLDVTELTFTDANSYTLTPTGVLGIFDPIVWSSSDLTVARVKNGIVTPISDGTATITVTSGEYSASCLVTVNAGLEFNNILTGIGFNSGYISNNGALGAASLDVYTDKFVVQHLAGQEIDVELLGVTDTSAMKYNRIVYYDESDAVVGYTQGTNGNNVITSTVPDNAAYAAVSINMSKGFTGINIYDSNDALVGAIEYTS